MGRVVKGKHNCLCVAPSRNRRATLALGRRSSQHHTASEDSGLATIVGGNFGLGGVYKDTKLSYLLVAGNLG